MCDRARLLALSVARALALLAATTFVGPARAEIPWPVNGAPVCVAPGDQAGLRSLERGCPDFLSVSWFSVGEDGDTLAPHRAIGVMPPDGDCHSDFSKVGGGRRVGAPGTARLSSGLVLGIPGCFDPGYPGHAWVAQSALTEQVLVSVPMWFGHELTVAHSGDLGTHDTPVLAGSGPFGWPDTAVVVVWVDLTTSPAQLRAQRVTYQGFSMWGGADGIALAPAAGVQGAPQAHRLADGSTLVVWTDSRNGNPDAFAQRLLADGTRAPGWPADGLALESRSENSALPRIVGDDPYGGPVFVLWEESGARFGGGTSIVVRRLLPSGLPDPAWGDSGVVVSESPTVDRLEDAGLDYSTGSLFVAWSDTRVASPANPTDLYARRLGFDGAAIAGWPATGLALCTAIGRQDHARLSVRGGSSVYAWEDRRSGEPAAYVTIRGLAGEPGCCDWLPQGNPATQAPSEQRDPVIQAGNAGGAFVAWEDGRDLATNGYDIYAQAFTVDGRNADVEPGPPPEALEFRSPVPNPSGGTTRFQLDLPRTSRVRVDVYDIVGRHVRTIAEGTFSAGPHDWTWRGDDDAGRRLSAGLYRVRALVDGVARSRSVVRLR